MKLLVFLSLATRCGPVPEICAGINGSRNAGTGKQAKSFRAKVANSLKFLRSFGPVLLELRMLAELRAIKLPLFRCSTSGLVATV